MVVRELNIDFVSKIFIFPKLLEFVAIVIWDSIEILLVLVRKCGF